jgi:hypothetical protein
VWKFNTVHDHRPGALPGGRREVIAYPADGETAEIGMRTGPERPSGAEQFARFNRGPVRIAKSSGRWVIKTPSSMLDIVG